MKHLKYLFLLIIAIFITGCGQSSNEPIEEEPDPIITECEHLSSTWKWQDDIECGTTNSMYLYCDECGEILDQKKEFIDHDFETIIVEPKCTEKGYTLLVCKNCGFDHKTNFTDPKGHTIEFIVDRPATSTLCGLKHKGCIECDYVEESFEFIENDYSTHGALHVDGIYLKDSHNEKFRLAGVSTFGLQWQPEYVNYDTFANLKSEFGANLVRLAMYTGEGGYCSGSSQMKKKMYDTVVKGIELATELNMYVIVDWHMLGVDDGDNNPLYYLDESKEFFDQITKQFSDHDNILFEIMNEPCYVTWSDCKEYAEEVIPVIRNNMPNAIILVGNPQWSSDLASVAKDPLVGYSNIMYTFHFYANDNTLTSKITTACETNKLPVFVTEHGGMDASGYGVINYTALKKWYTVLDKYNISMVAWSLSNLDSSSCMFKTSSTKLSDFSDSNLKEWGIFYKNRVRQMMGLSYDYHGKYE